LMTGRDSQYELYMQYCAHNRLHETLVTSEIHLLAV